MLIQMKEFPNILNVKNKDIFPDIFYNRVLCYFRKDIYEHIISNGENSYFDLEKFGRAYFKDQKDRVDLVKKLSDNIIKELVILGWKCKVSFGGTALFIYSTENQPPSCWEDGF
jgi:hypothetical protein